VGGAPDPGVATGEVGGKTAPGVGDEVSFAAFGAPPGTGTTVGGITGGDVTRSLTSTSFSDRSLYPTRNPREKKTAQTATPTRKTKRRCPVDSPLFPPSVSYCVSIATLRLSRMGQRG
jgi:hypothetical protein